MSSGQRGHEEAWITVIIAAHNASSTLSRTLHSLEIQTDRGWQAIIVDDASTDETAVIAHAWAAGEPRARVLRAPGDGPSGARNLGIACASTPYLLFLDADDTIPARHLGVLSRELARNKHARGVCCGFVRVDGVGATVAVERAPRMDRAARELCSQGPPTCIHAMVVRRDDVLRAGGFDAELRTNEDWDLWARLVRLGVPFAVTNRTRATYWHTPSSLTKDVLRMMRDRLTVYARLTGPDLRVPSAPALVSGACTRAIWRDLMWLAGLAVAQGQSAVGLLEVLAETSSRPLPERCEPWMAEAMCSGMAVVMPRGRNGLLAHWSTLAAGVHEFARAWACEAPLLIAELVRAVEVDIVRTGELDGVRHLSYVTAVKWTPGWLAAGLELPEGSDTLVVKHPYARPRAWFILAAPARGRMSREKVRRWLLHALWARFEHVTAGYLGMRS